jgi:hypothetical protein
MPKSNTLPQIRILNAETGEEIVRDASAEELAQMEIDAINAAEAKAELEAKAAEKSALLARLGLTEDELKTILG